MSRRVTVQVPFRNKDDDYVPVVDVLSVLTELAFQRRAFVQAMHVNIIDETVYLEVMLPTKDGMAPSHWPANYVLYRQPVHSLYDDRVSYQCYYGLAEVAEPNVPVYWLGVGMRLRNGKTRHFPADATLDGKPEIQLAAMAQQDPGN